MTFSSRAFPNPPAIQLANAIDAALARHPQHTRQEWVLQRWIGITDRTVREWRTGERKNAKFNVADRVLCGLRLNWWEVYNEQTVTKFNDDGELVPDRDLLNLIAFAFTGEGLGEQLELVA
jgi:hypothetical protein